MRVLVTGSRDWPDRRAVYLALQTWVVEPYWEKGYDGDGHFVDWLRPEDFTLVTGACKTGADAMAMDWAISHDFMPEEHPANWKQFGKAAGPKRNKHMVNLGADLCLAFIHNNSKGATRTADLAEKAGIKTVRYFA